MHIIVVICFHHDLYFFQLFQDYVNLSFGCIKPWFF